MEVTLPMRLAVHAAPDDPSVAAVSYGPVVLAGAYGGEAGSAMPELDVSSVTRVSQRPLVFQARAGRRPVRLIPVARAHHQHYTVY
jgi:hypothetical protein